MKKDVNFVVMSGILKSNWFDGVSACNGVINCNGSENKFVILNEKLIKVFKLVEVGDRLLITGELSNDILVVLKIDILKNE